MKIICYKPIKITIDASGLRKDIINVVIRHYSLLNPIICNLAEFLILNSNLLYATT